MFTRRRFLGVFSAITAGLGIGVRSSEARNKVRPVTPLPGGYHLEFVSTQASAAINAATIFPIARLWHDGVEVPLVTVVAATKMLGQPGQWKMEITRLATAEDAMMLAGQPVRVGTAVTHVTEAVTGTISYNGVMLNPPAGSTVTIDAKDMAFCFQQDVTQAGDGLSRVD